MSVRAEKLSCQNTGICMMENSLLILQQAGKDDDDGLLQDVAKKLSTFNQQLNTKNKS